MADATRPLPNPNEPDTKDYWAATKDHELRYQKCDECGTIVFHPRRHCTGCLSPSLSWQTASGKGTVYTYSVVRQSYHPFFREHIPYAIAWVDLDEGPRLLTNIVGVDDPLTDVHCGQRVEVDWEDHEELSIPLFKPVG
ncbi:MAG: OB-fold domain-containing protein [Gammaproteobacteria bacterium]|nr:OB-fold domain-containing protein [Gammaproteobacteria bacterium]